MIAKMWAKRKGKNGIHQKFCETKTNAITQEKYNRRKSVVFPIICSKNCIQLKVQVVPHGGKMLLNLIVQVFVNFSCVENRACRELPEKLVPPSLGDYWMA